MIDRVMSEFMLERVIFALAIYREAGGEPREGKIAVANVVMERSASPRWKGRSPYEVIIQAKQFSSMTFPGDPMTIRYPADVEDPAFAECMEIAALALDGKIQNVVPGADHYCTATVAVRTHWVDETKFVKQIGNHRFYNLDGDPAAVA